MVRAWDKCQVIDPRYWEWLREVGLTPKASPALSPPKYPPHVSPNRRVGPLASTHGSNLVFYLKRKVGPRRAFRGKGPKD